MRDVLSELVLDDHRPRRQFQGPQAAKVLGVEGTRLLVALELFPEQTYSCSWGKPADHRHTDPDGLTGFSGTATPPVGTRCLVLFAGNGVADPWVTAFSGWPA